MNAEHLMKQKKVNACFLIDKPNRSLIFDKASTHQHILIFGRFSWSV
jgi:hypothetical protein